ncbi:MAG: hypothetical protein AB1512_19370 [Thermodesulfobacteriota bacterium]
MAIHAIVCYHLLKWISRLKQRPDDAGAAEAWIKAQSWGGK